MLSCPYTVAELLSHRPPMILLDEVVGCGQGQIASGVTITPQSQFFTGGKGVPSYVGLEYMAQTCGLYVGLEGLSQGRPVGIGFLLGTRNFHTGVSWFEAGERLIVKAREVLREEPMGVFDCMIERGGRGIASAQLNVYRPSSNMENT